MQGVKNVSPRRFAPIYAAARAPLPCNHTKISQTRSPGRRKGRRNQAKMGDRASKPTFELRSPEEKHSNYAECQDALILRLVKASGVKRSFRTTLGAFDRSADLESAAILV